MQHETDIKARERVQLGQLFNDDRGQSWCKGWPRIMKRYCFIANRGASVRVPNKTLDDEKGYFEDRRPSSNMDPYLVCTALMDTILS